MADHHPPEELHGVKLYHKVLTFLNKPDTIASLRSTGLANELFSSDGLTPSASAYMKDHIESILVREEFRPASRKPQDQLFEDLLAKGHSPDKAQQTISEFTSAFMNLYGVILNHIKRGTDLHPTR